MSDIEKLADNYVFWNRKKLELLSKESMLEMRNGINNSCNDAYRSLLDAAYKIMHPTAGYSATDRMDYINGEIEKAEKRVK